MERQVKEMWMNGNDLHIISKEGERFTFTDVHPVTVHEKIFENEEIVLDWSSETLMEPHNDE